MTLVEVAEFVYTVLLRPKPLRQFANSCLRAVIPARIQRHGATIVLNPRDPVISGALTFGVYERAETRFLISMFRPGLTFLDIGANIGYYTALAQKRLGPNGRVIGLEPDSENFGYLQQTVAANGGDNAICIQKAATDHSGTMTLHASHDNRGDNRLYANDCSQYRFEVEVTTIDTLLAELSVPSVDLIKMDVQGFEGHALAGMSNLLRRSTQLVMLTEFWPSGLTSAGTDPFTMLDDLRSAGLTLYELDSEGCTIPLVDDESLVRRYLPHRYANLVCTKGIELPAEVRQRATR